MRISIAVLFTLAALWGNQSQPNPYTGHSTGAVPGVSDVGFCKDTDGTYTMFFPSAKECVEYTDETGQRVGVLAKKAPPRPTRFIVNDCPGYQNTSPLMEFKAIDYEVTNTAGTIIASIDPAERYFSLRTREASSPYLTVEVDDDYRPKWLTVGVDGEEVKMAWAEFETVILAWKETKGTK